MHRILAALVAFASMSLPAIAEETFVTIYKVSGNRITFSQTPSAGRGRGMRGNAAGAAPGQGRGRRGGFGMSSAAQPAAITIAIPATTKITAAMRERRTFEFRVGVELAGGLRHPIFTRMQKPLSARIVTQSNRITELNVISDDTDINQLNTDSSGQAVIAVRPKRPPSK